MSWASHTAERVSKAIGLDEGIGHSPAREGLAGCTSSTAALPFLEETYQML